jgi:hypothetical protein
VYKPLLVIHVASAVALLGPTYLLPLLARMRGNPFSAQILQVEAIIGRYFGAFAMASLLSGGWLIGEVFEGNFSDARWLHIALAIFFVMAGIGTGFCVPRTHKALAAAKEGDQETARKLMEPVDKIAVPIVTVLGVVVLYLMLIKPDIG